MTGLHWRSLGRHDLAPPRTAAGWAARLMSDQCTQEDRRAFAAWAASHPADAATVQAMHGQLDLLAAAAAHEPAVSRRLQHLRQQPDRRAFLSSSLALAASVAALGASVLLAPHLYSGEVYRTALGETREVQLDDGSRLLLNSSSRVRVAFNEQERRLWLEDGEARFEVARDAARPFRVFAAQGEVQALGTVFDVRLRGADMQVTLEEGKVAVFAGVDARQPAPLATPRTAAAVLQPGQRAEARAGGGVSVKAVDVKAAGAWRFGLMMLQDRPLAEAVSEINRYNRLQIVLDDPAIAGVRVSGVFHTHRPTAFAEAVTTAFPVRVARQTGDRIALRGIPPPGS